MTRRLILRAVIGLLGASAALAGPQTDKTDLRTRIDQAGDAKTWNADAVWVLDRTHVRVRDNGIGTAHKHTVLKILRPAAIRSQAVQVLTFDPFTNRLEVRACRIHRADGTIESVSLDRKLQQPQTAWGIFWGSQQFLIDLPRLNVGDAIELETEMTGFNVAYLASDESGDNLLNARGETLQPPVEGHWHDEVHFWSSYPIIEKSYSVRIAKDKPLQFGVYNGEANVNVMFEGDEKVYAFTKQNIPAFKPEPNMEATPNVATKVLLATLPTWREKAIWLYEVSEPQFDSDDAIRAKVDEIIAGLETPEEKYTALNSWVAENIRYAGTSRGMCEGYTVHKSTETFHDRAGVCKDKAGLLVTFLREAGFESYLVMTMARQRVDAVPADQFNHAVTCIRWEDGSLTLLDPTWMPKSRDNWSKLEPLQHVVYGLPEGKELAKSPYFPPSDNELVWTARSRIAPNNDLRGTFEFQAVGAGEGRLRRTLAGLHPQDRPDFFDETFQRISPVAAAEELRYVDPVDFSQPMQVSAAFEAPGFALGDDGRRYLKLPMMQTVFGDRTLYDIMGKTDLPERKYGLKLLATRLARIQETIELPSGWTAAELPEPISLDGPAASLQFDIEASGNQIRYTCELAVKRWTIPPDEYANFKAVLDAFENLTGHVVACEVEGASVRR